MRGDRFVFLNNRDVKILIINHFLLIIDLAHREHRLHQTINQHMGPLAERFNSMVTSNLNHRRRDYSLLTNANIVLAILRSPCKSSSTIFMPTTSNSLSPALLDFPIKFFQLVEYCPILPTIIYIFISDHKKNIVSVPIYSCFCRKEEFQGLPRKVQGKKYSALCK